jgi:iron complex outermembrane receptor protein
VFTASVHVVRASCCALLRGLASLAITLTMGAGSAFAQPQRAAELDTAYHSAAHFTAYRERFDLPAGGLAMPFVPEWRGQPMWAVIDPISNVGWIGSTSLFDFYGARTIEEMQAAFPAHFLKNKGFARGLAVNIAARRAGYVNSDSVQTWKGGFSWQINPEFHLRGSRAREIRAPNFQDLLARGRQNNDIVIGTLTGRTLSGLPSRVFGNLNLKPEITKTMMGGFSYEPVWLAGFSFTANYYDIKIKDAVASIGGNATVEQCNQSGQTSPVCDLVTRDPVTNFVVSSRTSPANFTEARTRGVDFEGSYRLPLASWFAGDPGEAGVRAILGYRIKNVVLSPLVTPTIVTARERGNPHLRGAVQASYERDAVRGFLQGRYMGRQIRDKGPAVGFDAGFDEINAAFYFDGQVGYAFMENKEIYLNVQNILDRKPNYGPVVAGAMPLSTDAGLYDQIGRMWRFGARFTF